MKHAQVGVIVGEINDVQLFEDREKIDAGGDKYGEKNKGETAAAASFGLFGGIFSGHFGPP